MEMDAALALVLALALALGEIRLSRFQLSAPLAVIGTYLGTYPRLGEHDCFIVFQEGLKRKRKKLTNYSILNLQGFRNS